MRKTADCGRVRAADQSRLLAIGCLIGTRAPNSNLPVAFIDFHAQPLDLGRGTAERTQQPLANILGQQFGRRIRHRQYAAVAAGENPAAIAKDGGNFVAIAIELNLRVISRQQHKVVQLQYDLAKLGPHQQKIDHQMICVQRAIDLGSHVIIVPVQTFATAIERDEMGRAENVLSFGDTDLECFSHGS